MCGIAGILRVYPPGATPPPHFESIPEAWLDLLDDSIKHRGPDGQGRFRDRALRSDGCTVDVALVHRRLSILDHKGGAQPMVSSPRSPSGLPEGVAGLSAGGGTSAIDCRFPLLFQGSPTDAVRYEPIAGGTDNVLAVTFNGCIYNHRELRKELEAKGHRFVTDHSDTEVLLHGWREWGENLAEHLDGMYAFAIWDRNRGDLILSRDFAQEKPLFSEKCDSEFLFSSCAGSLARLRVPRGLNVMATSSDWVTDWIKCGASNDSFIAGVYPWPYRGMCHSSKEYGDACFARIQHRLTHLPERDSKRLLTVTELDRLLFESVASRLDTDVELGCFLSGGVDSSLVAHYARKAGIPLNTFSMRMPDSRYDESEVSEKVASLLGTRHTTLDCSSFDASSIVTLIEQLGLPLGDSSLLPTFWLSQATRRMVKVAIGGDGGDELFCGYERHVAARRLRKWSGLVKWLPSSLLSDRDPKSFQSKARRLIGAASEGYWDLRAIFPIADLAKLIAEHEWPQYAKGGWNDVDPASSDFYEYLGCDLLSKVDTASMAVGLEVRSPMLSNALVKAGLSTSYDSLMPRGQRKGLLRAVARKYLPKEIVDRPKMGFAIPVGEWFRTDFGQMKTLLFDMLHSADPFPADLLGLELNLRFIDQMLAEHMESRRDHSQRLYMLLVLAIWCRWLRRIRNGSPK